MKTLIFNDQQEIIGVASNFDELRRFRNSDNYASEVDCSGVNALQAILELQDKFQGRLYGEDRYSTEYIMKQALYAEAELHEFLRELPNFKDWKKYDWNDDERLTHECAAKEEYIDFLHFVFNIGVAMGLDAEEIIRIYADKNIVNHSRQDNGY